MSVNAAAVAASNAIDAFPHQITLSARDVEIIRRVQSGAFAHPEFNDTPDYVDYFTADKETMPLNSGESTPALYGTCSTA